MSDDSTIVKAFQRGYELGYLRGSEASQALLKVRREQSMVHEEPGHIIFDPRKRRSIKGITIPDGHREHSENKLDPEPYLMEKTREAMKTHDVENEALVTAYEQGFADGREKGLDEAAEIANEKMDDQYKKYRIESIENPSSHFWAAFDGGFSSSKSIYNSILSLKQSKDEK